MKSITVHELREREGTPLIDVREEWEFETGRVPGAVNLPMSTIGDRLDELPDGAFDVICKVGGRSARVAEALAARGYDATNVDGGTDEWIAAGYPVEGAA
ncbi:rhodanese-like domain-containing protein [Microbacterium cremeum]|uniref:rhodanese-like domain-containing protein n=1 Tax=Microbacterium cremeum TaxID=2782169 RepID=UPI001888C58D|nr:rhodanese-like domain-containing protein [Microbacterium cremeum]